MLIVSRKKDQKLIVADEVEITILDLGRNRVRFGIKAPKHIHIQTHLKGSEPEPISIGNSVPEAADGNIAGVTSLSARRS